MSLARVHLVSIVMLLGVFDLSQVGFPGCSFVLPGFSQGFPWFSMVFPGFHGLSLGLMFFIAGPRLFEVKARSVPLPQYSIISRIRPVRGSVQFSDDC